MRLFSNLRKTALVTLITVVGIAVVAVMATLQYRSFSDYQVLGETKVLVSDIQSGLLTLRRNEKDFLARKDLRYTERFEDNYRVVLGQTQALQKALEENDAEDLRVDELAQIFKDYRKRFLAIADLQKQIGFHHEDGYYGTMRKAIHRVENLLETRQQHRLLKDMLMLRRQEKDFMLRKDSRYLEKHGRDLKTMRKDLAGAYLDKRTKTAVLTALAAYEKDFNALVAATREIGFNSNDGLHGEMRNGIHRGESVLYELRQEILQLESEAGSRMINQLVISAIVLTFLVGTLIRL